MHLVAIGGSGGLSAALRARELDSTTDVTVVVADAYPTSSSAAPTGAISLPIRENASTSAAPLGQSIPDGRMSGTCLA
jgi:hypothetical protein